MKTIQHFVNGKSFSGESKRTGKILNPAKGKQEAEVKLATTKDIKSELNYQMLIYLIHIFYITSIINFKKLPLRPREVNINLIINLRERLLKVNS